MPMMNFKNKNSFPHQKVDFKKNILILIKSFKKYYINILISFICIAISVVISIIAPLFLKDLTDEITNGAVSKSIDMSKITSIGITLITFYLSNAILS